MVDQIKEVDGRSVKATSAFSSGSLRCNSRPDRMTRAGTSFSPLRHADAGFKTDQRASKILRTHLLVSVLRRTSSYRPLCHPPSQRWYRIHTVRICHFWRIHVAASSAWSTDLCALQGLIKSVSERMVEADHGSFRLRDVWLGAEL